MVMIICAQLLAGTLRLECNGWSSARDVAPSQDAVVTLPVLALDGDGSPVTDLTQNDLKLYEGGKERPIELMARDPALPVRAGFLLDMSRSDSNSVKLLEGANIVASLLRTGDSGFVAAFAETGALMCPLSSDLGRIQEAINRGFDPRSLGGGTALSDAIFYACSEKLSLPTSRQALIVFSDMGENASLHTREAALAEAQRTRNVIYPIVVREGFGSRDDHFSPFSERAAHTLASETGGVYFRASTADAAQAALRLIRSYLDNTYMIKYAPAPLRVASIKVRCSRKGIRVVVPSRRF
jgi:VWFA-related protein